MKMLSSKNTIKISFDNCFPIHQLSHQRHKWWDFSFFVTTVHKNSHISHISRQCQVNTLFVSSSLLHNYYNNKQVCNFAYNGFFLAEYSDGLGKGDNTINQHYRCFKSDIFPPVNFSCYSYSLILLSQEAFFKHQCSIQFLKKVK